MKEHSSHNPQRSCWCIHDVSRGSCSCYVENSQLSTQQEQEPHYRLGPMMPDPGERDDGLVASSLPQIMATSAASGVTMRRQSPMPNSNAIHTGPTRLVTGT